MSIFPGQIFAEELEASREALRKTRFYLDPQDARDLLTRWKKQRWGWVQRRWSPLALVPAWRNHYQEWIDLCDAFIVGLERASESNP